MLKRYAPAVLSHLVLTLPFRGGLNDVLIDSSVELSDALKRRMALGAATGIAYLHALRPPVLHRDLKSPNIL
jgi:serine/threonine-protein kinase CTR1